MTTTKIPAEFLEAITGSEITDGGIGTADIADLGITTAKIANNAITAAKLPDNVITATHIPDGLITGTHLANSTVTQAKIADNSIGTDQLAGIARGKIIYGDSNGDPQLLTLGSNGTVLKSDGTDIAWSSDVGETNRLPLAGGTMTGNTRLNDNVRHKYGSGDYFQVYHDGSNAHMANSAGDTYIQNDNIVYITNAATSKNSAAFDTDGAVTLHYDNAAKLATVTGGVTVTGTLTAGDGHTFGSDGDDNLLIASSANENIVIDSAEDIIFDADGGDILFKDGGTEFGKISKSGGTDLIIRASTADKDIFLSGTDGSTAIDALVLDMSEAGAANFNSTISLGGTTSRTLGPVTGSLGTLQVSGSGAGGYEGLSIDGRVVVMHDGGNIFGIYNDVDDEWLFRADLNGGTKLYYDSSEKLSTISTGINVIGEITLSDTITHGNGVLDLYDGGSNTSLTNGVTNGNVKLQAVVSGVGIAAVVRAGDGALGQVDLPYQSGFMAYSPAVTNGGGNRIVFGSTHHNTGSDYSTSTGKYTAPRTGRYYVSASVLINPDSTSTYERILFGINESSASTQYGDTLTIPGNSSYHALNISGVFYIAAGDTISVYNMGQSPTYGTAYGAFSAFYLG